VRDLSIVARFRLSGWNYADGFEQAPIVEPVDPFQCGELDGFQVSPGTAALDHLGLVETVDGLGEGIIPPPALAKAPYRIGPAGGVA
jgi:hypothetical protein